MRPADDEKIKNSSPDSVQFIARKQEPIMEAFIVYCSPAGTTRKLAFTISSTLAAFGHAVASYDLANSVDEATIYYEIKNAQKDYCLFVGSPVYACHAVPVITRFISRLPDTTAGFAVPFVTWGGVTSGIALYEMAEMLAQKGYAVAGAAKILAAHSLMWQFDHPLGEGHPDEADENLVTHLITEVNDRIASKTVAPLSLSVLNYLPENVREPMTKIDLNRARQTLPQKVVDKNRCTQCHICTAMCPANAIDCNPFPKFNQNCMQCYTCVRFCPEQAIMADFSKMDTRLKQRSQEFSEQPRSAIFVAHE
jgi:ferredoxin